MSSTDTIAPRVWIGCLAAYNEGHLHGEWVDATDADELEEARERVIKTSPADFPEEHFLADNEGFGNLIGEYTSLERVAELGALIDEHGEAFLAFAEHYGDDDAETLAAEFQEAYCGEYESLRDYAMELADELGAVPDDLTWPLTCIDWDQAARELEADYYEQSGYVFRRV